MVERVFPLLLYIAFESLRANSFLLYVSKGLTRSGIGLAVQWVWILVQGLKLDMVYS